MEIGGNAKAKGFFRQHGGFADVKEGKFSDSKYSSRAAELYKQKLKAEAAQFEGSSRYVQTVSLRLVLLCVVYLWVYLPFVCVASARALPICMSAPISQLR